MKIRDLLIEGNNIGGVLRKRGITALPSYSIYKYSIFLLLSAIAIYGFTLSLANAAKPAPLPIECSISPNPASVTAGVPVTLTADVNRNGKKAYAWSFQGVGVTPSTSTVNPVSVTYSAADTYAVDLDVSVKGEVATCHSLVIVSDAGGPTPPPVVLPNVSINSTSKNGAVRGTAVVEQLLIGTDGYQIFGANDLGMHCGDFDTRISSILPPFNVMHAQVIRRGSEPDILTPDDGVEVVYSAASNPDDPILSGINSAGTAIIATGGTIIEADYPVLSSLTAEGTVFKTNFWDAVLQGAYDPFYPHLNPFNGVQLTPLSDPPFNVLVDVGLPMPVVELLHLHTPPALEASQQFMPGILAPFAANNPQTFTQFVTDQPFFFSLTGVSPDFQFGYVKEGVNWFEAAGLPLTAFDDFGRENPWPLYRLQALSSGAILASTDTVVPISGEANCGFCHNSIGDDGGNGAATQRLFEADVPIALASQDVANVPDDVSKEWAADINILRLHDLKHGSGISSPKYSPDLVDQTPVVCQTCHYTPALDLAQLGPLAGDPGTFANGRDQLTNKSMSNVMHSHHGTLDVNSLSPGDDGYDGDNLMFPVMPTAEKNDFGVVVNDDDRRIALQETCYQCHPGRRTDCLRGAMANGGMLCQDCHGDMKQVGDDFTRNVSLDNPGTFELAGDFYDDPESTTPRVPWANEPGCGSCHTGDAIVNLADPDDDTVVINNVDANMNDDGIRLFQAYRTGAGYTKATPIVPTNKRFAENVIEADTPAVTPGDSRIGNPMLYRVSTGHEGVFCEACHGATHGIWPNKNPNANDNVTATQLQGHTGTITECTTCHTGSFNIDDFKSSVITGTGEMDGPHGMHPVNDPMWKKHKEVFELNKDSCRTCHGVDGKGTVLSTTAAIREMECKNTDGNFPGCAAGDKFVTVDRNTPIACDNCHAMEN